MIPYTLGKHVRKFVSSYHSECFVQTHTHTFECVPVLIGHMRPFVSVSQLFIFVILNSLISTRPIVTWTHTLTPSVLTVHELTDICIPLLYLFILAVLVIVVSLFTTSF